MNKHSDFILSPIVKILEDAVTASSGVGDGIETFPLCDYIMQSVFLRMTGFHEQKLKCICWEMATHDYEYRYERFSRSKIGECSCYDEKKNVYNDIFSQIRKRLPEFSIADVIDKEGILKSTISSVITIFSNTNLSIWTQNTFDKFATNLGGIRMENSLTYSGKEDSKPVFLGKILKDKFEKLYIHRNKCAHNTQSYQQNLPTLKTLASDGCRYENYFVRFAILILIDSIFIELYKKYFNVVGNDI